MQLLPCHKWLIFNGNPKNPPAARLDSVLHPGNLTPKLWRVRWRMKRLTTLFSMAEGYCVKCKAKREIANAVEETMKNGRKAIKGKCPTCGTVMFKILGGKATPTPPAPPAPPAAPAAPTT